MNELQAAVTEALIDEWGKSNSAQAGDGDPATDYFLKEAPNFARAAIAACGWFMIDASRE